MNEDVTILLAREGHEKAFRQLYNRHREMVFQTAYRYTKSQEDAEDIMQETFIKAFNHLRTFDFRNDASFLFWLRRICINCAINFLRRAKRRKRGRTASLSDLPVEPESPDPSPAESVQMKQNIDLLQTAVQKLAPKQRIIFDLRYSQHLAVKEIADMLDCSESNIKTQLFRSVKKLRKKLEPIWREC